MGGEFLKARQLCDEGLCSLIAAIMTCCHRAFPAVMASSLHVFGCPGPGRVRSMMVSRGIVLAFEPDNSYAVQFLPLLEEKIRLGGALSITELSLRLPTSI